VAQLLEICMDHPGSALGSERSHGPPKHITGPLFAVHQGHVNIRTFGKHNETRQSSTRSDVHDPYGTRRQRRNEASGLLYGAREITRADEPDALGFGEERFQYGQHAEPTEIRSL
jgi:hypothetical protein